VDSIWQQEKLISKKILDEKQTAREASLHVHALFAHVIGMLNIIIVSIHLA
jgi:hypothetical protein